MPNRKSRKLRLARETVIQLTPEQTSRVWGGEDTEECGGMLDLITVLRYGCHTQILCTVTVCASVCPTCDPGPQGCP